MRINEPRTEDERTSPFRQTRSHRSKNLKGDRCAIGGTIIHVESGHLKKKEAISAARPPVNLLGSLVHRGGRSGSSDKPPPTLVFVAG